MAFGKASGIAMKKLLKAVNELRNSNVRKLVDSRLKGFRAIGKKSSKEIYKELCFCTLTANFDAAKSIAIQEKVGDGFIDLPEKKLEAKLRSLGYRYPNRAAYIADSRKHYPGLKKTMSSFGDESALREWLVENVKGLGFKEASHFMRNIGFENVAIIDFHVVDVLVENNLIEKPRTITKRHYLKIELVLKKISEKLEMSLAELDLYLWYLETGKVLK